MDKRRMALSLVLISATSLLSGCGRDSDGVQPLKGALYPLDLALVCNQSTPTPLRNEYPARDSESAFGNICVERDSGPSGLGITKIDIYRDKNIGPPLYEVRLYIGERDRQLMEKAASKASRSHRLLAFVVNGSVVAQASVTGLPRNGVIVMGGYDSEREASKVAARFEASAQLGN